MFGQFCVGWRREFLQGVALSSDAHFEVGAGGLDVGVSEPVSDHGDVIAGFDEVQGGGMAEDVGGVTVRSRRDGQAAAACVASFSTRRPMPKRVMG